MTDQPTAISRKYSDDLYDAIQGIVLAARGTMPDDERQIMTLDALGRAAAATLRSMAGDAAKAKALAEGYAKTLAELLEK